MKWSSALLAASLGLASAHGDHGQHIPKLVGARKFLSEMKARGISLDEPVVRREPLVRPIEKREDAPAPVEDQEDEEDGVGLEKRQNTSGQCGQGFGNCAAGYCCSADGWCGNTADYCTAPDCQINYGPGCDGNKKPAGADTSSVTRTKVGSVAYGGAGIYDCVNPGEIAITFDDGPYIYTNDLLDKLKSYGAHATFFITGNNIGKGMINDPNSIYPAIIRRMAAEGHQVASHTWSHQNASQLTNTQFTNQMVWNEIAINSILGYFPTYMRPPYSICENSCQSILSKLGYHVIYFDLDTQGYLNDSPTQIQASKDIWDAAINPSHSATDNFLNIEHDIHYQTVYNLTDYMLTSLFAHGYKSVTVGQCLGDPQANWYRTGPAGSVSSSSAAPSSTSVPPTSTSTRPTVSSATSSSATPTGSLTVSPDGTCGNGVTCTGSRFGSCCSLYGYCGSSTDYCTPTNCQPAFGFCGTLSSTTSAPASTSTYGYCGSTTDYCGTGCQTGFGSCTGTSTSSSAPTAQPTLVSSTNGYCGKAVGMTCQNSGFGACCNANGRCASNTLGCLTILGCQKDYGYCI